MPNPVRIFTTGDRTIIKRIFDIIISSVLLIVLSPVLLLLAVVIAITMGRPVIFSQLRPGLHGNLFAMYKFRTMTNAKDAQGKFLPDAVRLTALGRFLRSTSLDEFPEFYNVLKGEMSLIGPRPLLPEYLARYTPRQARRHEVLPGITGWAQINGRNTISWEDKFEMDVWYVDHRTFWLDMQIFFLTIYKIVRREGISSKGEATMQVFTGEKAEINQQNMNHQ